MLIPKLTNNLQGAVLKLSDTPVPFERNLGPPGEFMQGPPPSAEQIQGEFCQKT